MNNIGLITTTVLLAVVMRKNVGIDKNKGEKYFTTPTKYTKNRAVSEECDNIHRDTRLLYIRLIDLKVAKTPSN